VDCRALTRPLFNFTTIKLPKHASSGIDPRQAALLLAAHVTEIFPGYQEIVSPHLIFQALLQASNRHAAMSGLDPPPYVEQVQLDGPTEDPAIFIKAYTESVLEGKFKEKPLMNKFHAGHFGGLVFGPYCKDLQERASSLRFNRSSPIVYMNDSAKQLVRLAGGPSYDQEAAHEQLSSF
jgi:hypothetical protein